MSNETSSDEITKNSFELEYLQEHLEDIARKTDISNPKYSIKAASEKGDNYIATVYSVTIDGEENGERKEISLLFKCPPQNELKRQELQIEHYFPREVLFYKVLVPAFSELLQEHNLTISNIPICYAASDEDHKEVIVMEDLRKRGFVMRDRRKGLDYAHASLALRCLGRLHAYSFALRDQKPNVFRKFADIKEPVFRKDLPRDGFAADIMNILADQVKIALAEEDPLYLKRFMDFFVDYYDEMERSCNGDLAEPFAVINHGDFWTNNMMFKYEEGSSEPRDLYFFDFQISRYASPALDIVYLLFCCCDQELRSNHYAQLIQDYHESLSKCLTQLGSNPKKLFPFVALTHQLTKFGKFAAGMVMGTLSFFTAGKEDVVDASDFVGGFMKLPERIHRDHLYRHLLRDAIKDLIDMKYI